MHDLTTGSIGGHLARMAGPIAAGMLFSTAYFIVDLYFVAHVGAAAIAGVGAAGNIVFLVLALTQMLAAGTLALLSHAVGRKDQAEANCVFNQASALGALLSIATIVLFYPLAGPYTATLGASAATAAAGRVYLYCYIPGLALQFITTALGAALRATGIVQPTMLVQMASLTINIILAPILIAGWGTGHPLGVAGAGLASTIAVAAAVALMIFYFIRYETYVTVDFRQWRPIWDVWKRLLLIGIPAGGEFALMVVYSALIYLLTRQFGTAAQAGFGTGTRIMQAIFLPGMAIAFAAAPVAGQNFGAKHWDRVRETLRVSIVASVAIMIVLMLFCQLRADLLIRLFTRDARVIAEGSEFLRIISWNFIATGIIFSCSGLFQALGNTWPSLISSGSRLLTFALPAFWFSMQPGFRIETLWYISVASVAFQAVISLLLIRHEFQRRLPRPAPVVVVQPVG
ncbi:MAG TPA: MATE family efflux transporter [Rhizomicrobium sp.]|nr:MATE family efflux transporter [Rhizomicrobium sp.]